MLVMYGPNGDVLFSYLYVAPPISSPRRERAIEKFDSNSQSCKGINPRAFPDPGRGTSSPARLAQASRVRVRPCFLRVVARLSYFLLPACVPAHRRIGELERAPNAERRVPTSALFSRRAIVEIIAYLERQGHLKAPTKVARVLPRAHPRRESDLRTYLGGS